MGFDQEVIPRHLLEECVRLIREQKGYYALQRLKDYNIATFAQLERELRRRGIPTWKDPAPRKSSEEGEDDYPFEESTGSGKVWEW